MSNIENGENVGDTIKRPFDFLQYKKFRKVTVVKTDGIEIRGTLISFDTNINLVIENEIKELVFIKGNFVREII